MNPSARRIPFLAGPTGVGKTDVAVALAARTPEPCVILSIDARQAYRGLQAATGKPGDPDVLAMHRLLDLWDPGERGTAARFARSFWESTEEAWSRGERLLATVGSGLYLDACLGRVDPMPAADPAVRTRLHRQWEEGGGPELFEKLRSVDPDAAARLAPRDAQRVLRALEVWESTGRTLTRWQQTGHGPLNVGSGPPLLLLTREMTELTERIRERCRVMVSAGLEKEIRGLLDRGVGRDAPALKTLGYTEWIPVVLGEASRDEAFELFVRNTRRYARRQLTWFRNRYTGAREILLEPGETPDRTADRITEILPEGWGTAA